MAKILYLTLLIFGTRTSASLLGDILNVHHHVHEKVHERVQGVASAVSGLANINLNLGGHVGLSHHHQHNVPHHGHQQPEKPDVVVVVVEQEDHGNLSPNNEHVNHGNNYGGYGHGHGGAVHQGQEGGIYAHGGSSQEGGYGGGYGGGGSYHQNGYFSFSGGHHHHHSSGGYPQPQPSRPDFGHQPGFPNKPNQGFPNQPTPENHGFQKPESNNNNPGYNHQGSYKPHHEQADKPTEPIFSGGDNSNSQNIPLNPPSDEPANFNKKPDFKPFPESNTQSTYGYKPNQHVQNTNQEENKQTNDDGPLFVPLEDFGGDQNKAPKRETEKDKEAEKDDFPIDIRFKDE